LAVTSPTADSPSSAVSDSAGIGPSVIWIPDSDSIQSTILSARV
jgi:hypothetical protein